MRFSRIAAKPTYFIFQVSRYAHMGLGQELAVAAKCVWIQVGHPFTLVYPVLTAAFALGASALFLGYALAGLTGVVESNVLLVGVALVAYVLLLPVGVVFLMVAYSYELNERYNGRRPVPLEGAVVASRKFPEIAVSAVIVAVAFNASQVARGSGSIGRLLGSLTAGSLEVATVFLYPAIALGDGDAVAVLEDCADALRERWGTASVTAVGVRTLSSVLVVAGFLAAGLILAGSWLGGLPVDLEFPGTAFAAAGAIAVGIFLAILSTMLVLGPASTALYLYATEDPVPERLRLDVDDVAEVG